MPVTCYMTIPPSRSRWWQTPTHLSSKTAVATSTSSHPSVDIMHQVNTPVSNSSHLVVPVTFSPPLTPSDHQPVMFTFAGMSAAASQTQTVSAFNMVHQHFTPISSSSSSSTTLKVFNVVHQQPTPPSSSSSSPLHLHHPQGDGRFPNLAQFRRQLFVSIVLQAKTTSL
ncbi:hypothetical protein ACOMHN_014429 [Nucella lapillus]